MNRRNLNGLSICFVFACSIFILNLAYAAAPEPRVPCTKIWGERSYITEILVTVGEVEEAVRIEGSAPVYKGINCNAYSDADRHSFEAFGRTFSLHVYGTQAKRAFDGVVRFEFNADLIETTSVPYRHVLVSLTAPGWANFYNFGTSLHGIGTLLLDHGLAKGTESVNITLVVPQFSDAPNIETLVAN